MDIKPTPTNQTSLFLIKDGIGILRLICLLNNLEIELIGQMPHPKRPAKRNTTNRSGKLNCQHRIRAIFLPPIEMSDCTASK
ncbi:MAG: hypothetical protein MAG551_00158 [Candidatus Scalindua arabica]|uniref:Uncharacterized protein n=1 Tax=Candidatus Scalindua arabica TaxID=1127984 RepID=A0A941VZZ8_9BACT|nr:hypothetical protein [Candidatus Scalindua arabica]